MTENTLLQVNNLTISFKTYLGVEKAVRNISFSIKHEEIVEIVGESG